MHLWCAKCSKFATSVPLRCTVFELYVSRSNIATKHQNFGRCVTASRASETYVQKLRKLLETALSMFWLLDRCSAMKCKTVGSCDKLQTAWWALRNLDCVFRKCWDSGIWFDPFEIHGSHPPRKKQNIFSTLKPPKFWKIIITVSETGCMKHS